jgi:hypothetical protein
VYVAGASGTSGRATWIVRASTDGGGRWQYADASNASIAEARPRAVHSSPYGVFVAGEVGNAGSGGWMTRRFGRDGWTNDDMANGLANGSGIAALAADRDGTVLAAGWGGSNGARWILRMRDAASGGWTGVGVDGGESDVVDAGRARAVSPS